MTESPLRDASRSGVYFLPVTQWQLWSSDARRLRLNVLDVLIPETCTTHALLVKLGAALHFPVWYGANFDALFDCLTDPDWQPAEGHLITISGLAALNAVAPDDCLMMIEVLQAAADARRAINSPFWVLIDIPAHGVATLLPA